MPCFPDPDKFRESQRTVFTLADTTSTLHISAAYLIDFALPGMAKMADKNGLVCHTIFGKIRTQFCWNEDCIVCLAHYLT